MDSYGQYCPLAKGAEVFAERWTPLILRELLRGSTTFNDLHRGVPRMSRTLLSRRLKKLEACGVIERHPGSRGIQYGLTRAGQEFGPVVTELGTWAQRWFRSTFNAGELDAAQQSGQLTILGPRDLKRRLDGWLRLSPYAPIADARCVLRSHGVGYAGNT